MYQKFEAYELRLGNLLKIDQAILENKPLETIAEIALQGIAELFPGAWITIASLDDDRTKASILAVNSDTDSSVWESGEVVPAKVFGDVELLGEGNYLHVQDISAVNLLSPLKEILTVEEISAYLVIPLVSQNNLNGTLLVGTKGEVGFHKNEIEMLIGIGAQLAISIAQSNLNVASKRRRDRLSTLLDISNALSSSLNLTEVMQLTINESTRVLGLETGAFYLLEDERLYLGATTPPLPPDFPEEYRIAKFEHHPHIQKAIIARQPVSIEDALTADLTPQERGVSVERGLRSLLYVPLPVNERIIGVLIMGTVGRTHLFTQGEIDLCSTFSSQMALAVENARLHHAVQQHALEMEARVKERTAELEALTYSISHDLRGPLRAIQGFGQILEEDYSGELSDDAQKFLQRMIYASKRLEGMLEGLLSLREVGKKPFVLENLDLSEIAEEILSEFIRMEPDRKIESRYDNCENFCKSFYGDRTFIEILLTNLFSNAIKFTKEREVAVIQFGCCSQDGKSVFFVKDNGIGFDPRLEDELYVPFRRLHGEGDYPGFGIGMTIVKKIIDLHHGEIWVETEKDKGTTVYFSLENLA